MKLSINLNHSSYDIVIQKSISQDLASYVSDFNQGQKFIVCFSSSLSLYVPGIISNFKNNNYDIEQLEINDGEKFKSLDYIQHLAHSLMDLNCKRDTVLVALGGGTVGDTVGFLSSIFMRGIRYINVPTTLLAMVDSSIGGKTGVNYEGVKNVLGAFHQPQLVCIDPLFLKSLDKKQIYSGIGEVIKYGLISDPKILDNLIKNYNCIIQVKDLDLISNIIYQSCLAKKLFIEKDVLDEGYRNILNFGHTLGHIIESKYQLQGITHGESVINGMFLSLKLSHYKKIISDKNYSSIMDIFNKLEIKHNYKLEKSDLEKINFDKKTTNNSIRFILLESIGCPMICDDISIKDILKII